MRSAAIVSSSVLIEARAFSLRIFRSAMTMANSCSSADRTAIRSLMPSTRIMISSSTSSSSARRAPKVPSSCCVCSSSFAEPVPEDRRFSSRSILVTTCSTSPSDRASSRFTSLSSVSAAIRRSRILFCLIVVVLISVSSGKVAALFFKVAVERSNF